MHDKNSLRDKFQAVQAILRNQQDHPGYGEDLLPRIVQSELDELTIESLRHWTTTHDSAGSPALPLSLLQDILGAVYRSDAPAPDAEDLDEWGRR